MPDYRHGRPVLKPTAVNVIREGIRQAKKAHAPSEVIQELERALVTEGLVSLFSTQNQHQN